MKFKRILAGLFTLALIFPSLFLPTFAHPGGTDSAGGHKDHDTGEYHYHHGYPAHQHTDVDSDGYEECPYRPDWEERQAIWNRYTRSWKPEYNYLFLIVLFSVLAHLLAYAANYSKHIGKEGLRRICDASWVILAILSFFPSLLLCGLLHELRTREIKVKRSIAPLHQATMEPEGLCGTILLEQHRSRHKKFCAFLWGKAPAFLKASGVPPTNRNCANVFAVLFYISVKVMRSKTFSGEVYAQFPDVISDSMRIPNDQYISAIIQAYRQIAPELNASGIDPLTPDELDLLWSFLLSKLSSADSADDNAKPRFTLLAANVIRNTNAFKDSEIGSAIQYSIGELPNT